MAKILSQEEIDALLSPIDCEEETIYANDYRISSVHETNEKDRKKCSRA